MHFVLFICVLTIFFRNIVSVNAVKVFNIDIKFSNLTHKK